MKKTIAVMSLMATSVALNAADPEDSPDKESSRQESHKDSSKPVDGGYDWSKFDRGGRDEGRSCDGRKYGTIDGPNDSKD
jgi:hypothetical protein